jgi:hypothetical protein
MIGDKITINNIEWEEISEKEFSELNLDKLTDNDYEDIALFALPNKNLAYYKKVNKVQPKEVFPKVFEDCDYKIQVDKIGLLMTRKRDNELIILSGSVSLPLLQQALAFRDKMMEKKE